MRSFQFANSEYYHIYNRGVDKQKIFLRYGHYSRFLTTIRNILNTGSATPRLSYNQGLALKSKITLLCYCLMPNHYHLLLQQTTEPGVTEFMHKLDTSYTMFFNKNNHRSGRFFESTFKATKIESEEQFLHVSRYIHLNPVIARLVEKPEQWHWSSYREYMNLVSHDLCDTKSILSLFSSNEKYQKFDQKQKGSQYNDWLYPSCNFCDCDKRDCLSMA